MSDLVNKVLVRFAIALGIIVIGWSLYDGALRQTIPGENDYHAANKYFEDGQYQLAKTSYQASLAINPSFIHAKRGLARALMQLNEHERSLQIFNEVIKQEPSFAASYANRGILHDRMGNYSEAISDYTKAIGLDESIADGPSWLTRFLRNQARRPPNVSERLQYLKKELLKPEHERLLRMPELDDMQKPYKS